MLLKRCWIFKDTIKLSRCPIPDYSVGFAFCVGCEYIKISVCNAPDKIHKTCTKYRQWLNENKPKTPPKYVKKAI